MWCSASWLCTSSPENSIPSDSKNHCAKEVREEVISIREKLVMAMSVVVASGMMSSAMMSDIFSED